MPYQMSGYEIGTYFEIYLPKKVHYQPFLFEVLTRGFNRKDVQKHFLKKGNRKVIRTLLGPRSPWSNYDTKYVKSLPQFLYGYSMYEVDGVFGDKGSVVEERTQVLRMMFRVNLKEIAKKAKASTLDIRVLRGIVSDYLRAHDRNAALEHAQGQQKKVFEVARTWRDQLGFFVFGYIVCELTKHIMDLRGKRSIAKTEDEIWVTHFANIELDRVLDLDSKDLESLPKLEAPARSVSR